MSTPDTDPTMQHLRAVDQLIGQGALLAAATQLDEAARAAPGDPRVYLMGARMAEAAGRPQEALAYLRRAAGLSPQWAAPVTELALLLARQDRHTEALAAARQAVALAPDSIDVLHRAIHVAHQTLNPHLALQWLEQVLRLDPGNASAQLQVARDLSQIGEYRQSLAAYAPLVEAYPAHADIRLGRAKTAILAGEHAQARQDCAALVAGEPDNPTYRFWLEVAHGQVPPTQPAAMTQALFDGYAPQFDRHLVEGLQYQVPARVAALVAARYPDNRLDLLDAGCGTGLLGKHLGRIQGALVGVDLSPRMVEQAARLQRYDQLHTGDLLDFLVATPDAHYDVVAACDVFIYVGDLTAVIPQAGRAIRPGGHCIFSCEAAQPGEADLVLRPSTRYAHQLHHVQALCTAAGFDDTTFEPATIRVEDGERIEGYIVVARKAA
ncbi:MAG TPA: methyltransferase domain-containing protein [Burkholderiaceae bacterium]